MYCIQVLQDLGFGRELTPLERYGAFKCHIHPMGGQGGLFALWEEY